METNRKNSGPALVLAAAMLIALFGSSYALSTRDRAEADQPVAVVQMSFDYFPAQYVNQAQGHEEHIQAF